MLNKTVASHKKTANLPVKNNTYKSINISRMMHIHPMLQLQQSIGNQAVLRLIRSGLLQAERKTGQPGTIFGKESGKEKGEFYGQPVGEHVENNKEIRSKPAAPLPNSKPLKKSSTPPIPLSKPGQGDLHITVNQPEKITKEEVLSNDVFRAPSSGLSFRLSRHAKFRQDEYVITNLRWKNQGSKLPEANQPEEYGIFKHSWTSETEERNDLPGNPIMLKDSDGHIYGLAVEPGRSCEMRAKKRIPFFDRIKSDWTFRSNGKFVDTVEFTDRIFKRVYYFNYRCIKEGNAVNANVEYTNVDEVNKT